MPTDYRQVLDELTGSGLVQCDDLVECARRIRRQRARRRSLVTAGFAIGALAAGTRFLVPAHPPASTTAEPAPPPFLTKSELLDSFGDDPVALVTWPDGRQQLLTIATGPRRGPGRWQH